MGRIPSRRAASVLFLIAIAAAASPAPAQQAATPGEALTLKERLGAKWTDEQRVDNCKVPLDKRGPKPRPDACPKAAAARSAAAR